jgi:hypothetical protein
MFEGEVLVAGLLFDTWPIGTTSALLCGQIGSVPIPYLPQSPPPRTPQTLNASVSESATATVAA